MKIQTTKKENLLGQHKLSKTLGFTLVELIVVITILAILATIAFIGFQNYTKDARNGNRISTLKNIEGGLELYFLKTGRYPSPEGNVFTGTMNGKEIMYSGEIGENIVKAINLNKLAVDPTLNQKYKYGVNFNKLEYNLGGILESATLSQNIVPTTYAASYYGQVTGNYKGYIKYSTGSSYYIANIPSLIFSYSGTVTDIFTEKDKVSFITQNGKNSPYELNSGLNNETPDAVIAKKTGKANAKFENIDITPIVNAKSVEEKNLEIQKILGNDESIKQTILDSFGADSEDIFQTIVTGEISNPTTETPSSPGNSGGTSGSCQDIPPHAVFFNNTDSYSVENSSSSLTSTFKLIPAENTCNFTCEDDFTWDEEAGSCRLACSVDYFDGEVSDMGSLSCSTNEGIIPTKVNGEFVTKIGDWIFSGRNFDNIIIPSSVTSIGDYAFEGNNLTSITIPNSVTSIGAGAFSNNQLTSISIPNSVVNIGNAAFNANNLPDNQAFIYKKNSDGSIDNTVIISYGGANKSPTIQSNINTIGNYAFYNNQLTSITIPSSVVNIGINAFSSNQLTSITIPNSVTNIGNHAFSSNQLTSITIPNSVTSIGTDAFSQNKITSFTLPNGITSIPNGLFNNNLLTSVVIPNSVTSIGDNAFHNNKLTSITLPNTLTSIGFQAFRANQLTSVVIPNSVTSIGGYAFNLNRLTSITLPNTLTNIPSGLLNNNLLTSVTIPNSVTSIGTDAFRMNKLTSITIPNSVTSIGGSAFTSNGPNNTSNDLGTWSSGAGGTWTLSGNNWIKQ